MSVSVSERMSRVMPSATSAVLGLAAELREAGRPVISLGAGEPDFDTPDHIKQAAIQAIHDGETKYTAIDGTSHLKAAIQRKFERDNQLSYAPEQILVSVGAKHTLFNACMGILIAGDEAIIRFTPLPHTVPARHCRGNRYIPCRRPEPRPRRPPAGTGNAPAHTAPASSHPDPCWRWRPARR